MQDILLNIVFTLFALGYVGFAIWFTYYMWFVVHPRMVAWADKQMARLFKWFEEMH